MVIESEGNQLRSRSKTSGWVVGKSFLKGSNPRNQPKPKHSGTKLKGIGQGPKQHNIHSACTIFWSRNQPEPKHGQYCGLIDVRKRYGDRIRRESAQGPKQDVGWVFRKFLSQGKQSEESAGAETGGTKHKGIEPGNQPEPKHK